MPFKFKFLNIKLFKSLVSFTSFASFTNVLFLFLLGILIVFICTPAFAYKKAIGWHWYNELPFFIKEKSIRDKKIDSNKKYKKYDEESVKDTNNAVTELTKLRKVVQEAKAEAILYPTEVNVRDYLALQNHVSEKAAIFSRIWQKVLLDYPELDYRILNPTQNGIQSIIYDGERKKENEAIRFFKERYGLFFFYRGNNPIDQELAKVVDIFIRENNISLKPISVDGKVLEIFSGSTSFTGSADTAKFSSSNDVVNSTNTATSNASTTTTSFVVSPNDTDGLDHGQAKKLGVEYFPALILVDPKSKKTKPLNYGFVSVTELRTRFLQVATNFQDGV